MIFSRPLFLWAMPLVGLPLLLHVWGRRRSGPIPFSNVGMLKESLQDHYFSVQIRRWILLLVRSTLIATIVVALAQPILQSPLGAADQRVVLALDASYSMRAAQYGQSAFDRARSMAKELLEPRQSKDAWGLVIFSDRVEQSVPVTGDRRSLLSALQSAEPTFRSTLYAAGLDQARALLGDRGTVVLLSDMASHGGPVRFSNEKGDFFVVGIQVANPVPNGAVTGLNSSPGTPVRADFRRWGALAIPSWSLIQGGRVSARGRVVWNGEKGTTTAPFLNGPAEVVLDHDALPLDDRYFFAPPQTFPGSVGVVNGAPSLSPVGDEMYYVRPVLNQARTSGWSVENVAPDDLLAVLKKNGSPGSKVVCLFNPPLLSSESVRGLTDFVHQGGGLWVTAGDRDGWKSLVGLLPLGAVQRSESEETLRFVEGSLAPSLKGFSWESVTVDRFVTGPLRPDSETVLETRRSRQPVLSLRLLGAGRVGFWGSTIDRDWTSFPARAGFPVVVMEMLHWLSEPNRNSSRGAYHIGDILEQEGPPEPTRWLIRPDGKREPFTWEKGRWRYSRTDRPGFYEMEGNVPRFFAVNVRAESEGNPTPLSETDFISGVARKARLLVTPRDPRAELMGLLKGRDVAPLLAKIILGLVFLETLLLVFYTRRRS